MLPWILRRLLAALATAAAIAVVGYLALYARPDAALRLYAGEHADPQAVERLRAAEGLDRPLLVGLGTWISGAARGNLGDSWSRRGEPVAGVLLGGLPYTLALTGSGLLLQLLLGVAVAAASVHYRGTWRDALISSTSLGLYAIPEFCLGLLLLWPLAVKLGWFPLSGAGPLDPFRSVSLLERLHHLVLPALCLGLGGAAVVARLLRVRWEEELGSPYVLAARARGLSARRILWRHGLRGAAGPLCTAIGLSLPGLVGGAVVVERVFNWPGLGTALVQAAAMRDLPLLAGANLLLALLVTLGGLLGDVTWVLLDPRVRTT